MKEQVMQILEAVKNSPHRKEILKDTHVLDGDLEDVVRNFEAEINADADLVAESFDNLQINDQNECMIKFVGELTTGQIEYINNAFKDNGCPFRIIDKDEL